MRKPYFRACPDAPPPLRIRVQRRVRFEEVDPLGIVWHGRYPSYLEDGRVALGGKYGLGYMDFYHHGVMAPIKQMHLDYLLPLRFEEEFSIEALLHWSDATRLNHEFILRNQAEQVVTTGYTVQLLTDSQQRVLLVPPPFYEEFRQRWRAGELV
ncbi:MAG: acyl-CoA thioesterase [Pelovirga sp.]